MREDKIRRHEHPDEGFGQAGTQEPERGNKPPGGKEFEHQLNAAGEDGRPLHAHGLHGGAQAENQAHEREE